MINIDLNKAPHPHVIQLLLGLVPGLFLEACILITDRNLRTEIELVGREHYYTVLFLGVFLAFVVGTAFISWVRSIQFLIAFVYRYVVTRLPDIQEKRAQVRYKEILEEIQEAQKQNQQTAVQPHEKMQRMQQSQMRRYAVREMTYRLSGAWGRVAQELLKRYGIFTEEDFLHSEYWRFNANAWLHSLGEARPRDHRGNALVVAIHATGWSGLVALHFAPHLQNLYFLALCVFMIGFGLFHDYQVARNYYDPVFSWILKIRRTLDELRSLELPEKKAGRAVSNNSEGEVSNE